MRKTIELIKADMTAINAKHDLLHIIWYLLFSYNKRPVIIIRQSMASIKKL